MCKYYSIIVIIVIITNNIHIIITISPLFCMSYALCMIIVRLLFCRLLLPSPAVCKPRFDVVGTYPHDTSIWL